MKSCGNSKYPGEGGPDPTERSVAAADVALPHRAHGKHFHKDTPENKNFRHMLPDIAQGMNGQPPKLGPYPAPLPASHAHGYGHGIHRDGHLRLSGNRDAHRIGKK